ncbi:MAG: DRTGG domain-containing protein [Ignavibacteriales bacterium]
MTVGDVARGLDLKALTGEAASLLDRQVTGGYCSDLLSDVMANAKEGVVWVTIQTHKNVVAVAVLTGVAAVIMTGGRQPDGETLAKAEEEKVVILTTCEQSFAVAGKLYSLLRG